MRLCQGLNLTQQTAFLTQLLREARSESPQVGSEPLGNSGSLHSPRIGGVGPPSSCYGEAWGWQAQVLLPSLWQGLCLKIGAYLPKDPTSNHFFPAPKLYQQHPLSCFHTGWLQLPPSWWVQTLPVFGNRNKLIFLGIWGIATAATLAGSRAVLPPTHVGGEEDRCLYLPQDSAHTFLRWASGALQQRKVKYRLCVCKSSPAAIQRLLPRRRGGTLSPKSTHF